MNNKILEINFSDFEKQVENMSFADNGDDVERRFGKQITERFDNSEKFWKKFVAPATNRIDPKCSNPQKQIEPRFGISDEIERIISLHYSIFVNLTFAHYDLDTYDKKITPCKRLLLFNNFYAHLGTVLDLVDDFLLEIYKLVLECNGKKTELPEKKDEKDFLRKYYKIYEKYWKQWKSTPVYFFKKENLVKEYFKNESIKRVNFYYNFINGVERKGISKPGIRNYRNKIIHNIIIARLIAGGKGFVPKTDKINEYDTWNKVYAAINDQKKLCDFEDAEEQMNRVLNDLEGHLNGIWSKPINDFGRLFYQEHNDKLLENYNIVHSEKQPKKNEISGHQKPSISSGTIGTMALDKNIKSIALSANFPSNDGRG